MVDTLTELPPDPILERRETIQRLAAQTIRRRSISSAIFLWVMMLAFFIALVPLGSVLYALIAKGSQYLTWHFLTGLPPSGFDVLTQIGGVGNALLGTIIIVGAAAIVAVPIAVILGIYLAEADTRWSGTLRAAIEIMTGLPSILLGVFAYEVIVSRMNNTYSGLAGMFALAILMVPVIAKASELALRGVPQTLKEAGLALGARHSRVTRGVVLPAALPGVITGVLLSLARAIGETAPVLLVIGSGFDKLSWNPLHTMSTLSLQIYQWSQNPSAAVASQQESAAWGVALALVMLVMILSVGSRVVAARMRRERH
jgi:phosphate transport system permease protein